MSKRLYVGNLAFHSTEDSIRNAFQRVGVEVLAVQVMMDRATGRSRGFGFVDVAGDQAAQTAIEALHDTDLDGRKVTVNEARERTPNRPGGGGFGGGGGYGGPPRNGGGGGGGRPGGGRDDRRGGRGRDDDDRW
jgi:RNA recognition motif-containing protein